MTETEKHETNLKNWEFVRKMGKDEYERLNRNPLHGVLGTDADVVEKRKI